MYAYSIYWRLRMIVRAIITTARIASATGWAGSSQRIKTKPARVDPLDGESVKGMAGTTKKIKRSNGVQVKATLGANCARKAVRM